MNANEIFYGMPEMKDVETKLAAKSETISKSAAAIEEEYKKKVEVYSKTPTDSLTEAIILDRRTELENLEKRFQDFLQTSRAEYEKEQQTLLAPLQEKFRKAVKDVGDENSYTYIFDTGSGALLHVGSNAVNASSQVKAKLGITN